MNEKKERGGEIKKFGPSNLSYNEILEMELSKIKEYLGLMTPTERKLMFSLVGTT